MAEPPNSRALRRVEIAVLSKRGLDLMRKSGVSGFWHEIWIEVNTSDLVVFKANSASKENIIGIPHKMMLGFKELVDQLVRAADDTAHLDQLKALEQLKAPPNSQSGYFGFLCELACLQPGIRRCAAARLSRCS